VYGPGDIAQAHAADEWIALGQLDIAAATYHRLMETAQ
jgi:acetylornithine deacetylase